MHHHTNHVLERIASKIKKTRDLLVFSTVCRDCKAACMDSGTLGIVVTNRSLDAGQDRWILENTRKISRITWKRCVFSPFPDEWLGDLREAISVRWLYCRVHVDLMYRLNTNLRELVVHQMNPGENPGVSFEDFRVLESLDVTFSKNWGFVVVSGLSSRIRNLRVRILDGDLHFHGLLPRGLLSVDILARHVVYGVAAPLMPAGIQRVRFESDDIYYPLADLLGPTEHLRELHLTVGGCAVVPSRMPSLEVLEIAADTIVINTNYANFPLKSLKLCCRYYFATTDMSESDWRKIDIPGAIFMARGKTVSLRRM